MFLSRSCRKVVPALSCCFSLLLAVALAAGVVSDSPPPARRALHSVAPPGAAKTHQAGSPARPGGAAAKDREEGGGPDLFAPTLTATKGVDKASANLGDTLNYTVTVNNSGTDATGMSFADTLETNLTFVPGSLQVSPIAVNDSYTCTGNLSISIPAGVGVLANDYLGLNPAATITAYDAASLNGGAVSVAPDGSFTYEPAAGYTGTDTFTYTLLNTTGTSTATVSVAVSGVIWFINNAAGACSSSCDGRLSHPFTSLAAFIAAGSGNGGDRIFIYSGAGGYAGNLTLKLNQRLIGQGDALTASTLGFTPAPYGPALPGAATKPTLTGSLALANGVTVLAVDWVTTSMLTIGGVGVTGVTIGDQCTVTANGGLALYLNNASGNFTFRSISSNGNQGGIIWNNGTPATGSLTVTGDGSTAGSGGTIHDVWGSDGNGMGYGCGVYLKNAGSVSLSWMNLYNFQNYAVRGLSVTNFTMNQCSITGTSGDNAAYYEGCVSFGSNTGEPGGPANGLTGSATISNCTITGGLTDNIRVANQSGTLNRLTLNSDTISTAGNHGLFVQGESTAVVNVTANGCTFTSVYGDHLRFLMTGANTANLNFQNNVLSNPAPYGTTGSGGVTLISGNNAGGANTTFTISYNTTTGARADAIHVEKRLDPGTLSGSLARNKIGESGTANSGSATGSGIWVQNAGLGTVTANLSYNEIYQYNRDGLTIQAGGGTASGGALNATLTNNWAWSAGTGGGLINGLYVKAGTTAGDSFAVCADSKGTGLQASSASGGGYGLHFAQRMATTVTVPGYTGANNDNNALTTYEYGINSGTFTTFASNTVGSGGGGFVGGGACAQPSTFAIPVSGETPPRDERLAPLTDGQIAPLVQEVFVRLALAGVPPEQLARLEKIRVRVGDLPIGLVAEGYPEEIVLDRSAAGRGWFVDPTPYDDAEFEEALSDGSVRAGETSPARSGVDLLSVLLAAFANELGTEPAATQRTEPDRAMDLASAGEPAAPAEMEAVRRFREFLPEAGVRCLALAPHAPEAPEMNVAQAEPTLVPPTTIAPPSAESRTESGETVSVTIGALPAGKSVIIKFAATIADPLAVPATQVTNQGTVSGSNFSTVLTNIATTTLPCPGVPAVTGISPSQGPQVGGTVVTITGTGFLGATSVTFGATPAASYLVNGDTSITAVSPAGTGIVDIRVSTPCVTSAATGADQFAYRPAPVVITALPSAGPEAGGTVVTITGSGFTGATAVTFGPTPAVSLSVVDDSTIQAVTPPGGGTVEVHVTTAGGTSTANPPLDRFTYLPVPVLYSVFPSAGPQTGGTTVTLTGSGFTGATSVNFGATPALSYLVSSDITITAVSPPGTGTVDVIVTTPGGTSSVTSADRFTYFSVPVVMGIVPSSGPQAGGTTVTISGTGLGATTAVNFGATPAASFGVVSESVIYAVSPPGTGTVDVLVTTFGGTSSATPADQFTFLPVPAVWTISPYYGPETGGTTVNITGTGLLGATSVNFDATPAASFLVVNDTSIQATSPPGTGIVDIRVTTPGGTSLPNPATGFRYFQVPEVTNVYPSAGPQAGGTTVTITGTGLGTTTAVNFGATPAASFGVVSESVIYAVSPPGTGTVDVLVTTLGGTSSPSPADWFKYCPAITISPATLPDGVKGAAYNQTITATGGSAPYTFAVTSGALPNGLTLSSGGALTGTPSVADAYSFTVTATDAAGCTASQPYTLTIACATLVTNLNDSGEGSLRWAVSNACIGDIITFAPGLTGVIHLTSGAIYFVYTLTIQGPGASVLAVDGGGLDRVFYYLNNPTGTLTLSGLTIRNGAASTHGGGIYAGSPLALADCVVSGCVTSTGTNAGGGGIYAQAGLTMDRCTVSGNQMTGGGYGGGLEVNVAPGVITNCTFSGNHAPGSGGGVMIANTTCTLLNCTVTQNSVPTANPGGGIAVLNGTLNLKNSIVAGNAGQGQQIFTSASTVNDNGGNVTSGDPLLAPLGDYGGPTQTHALLCGSPALDAGVAGYPSTDQRAVPRPQNGASDSGAFEANIFMGPSSLPGGQTNTPYIQNLTATGGTAPYTFTPVGSLPAWLSLAADGSLAGTPTALGSWTFSALAMDSQGFIGACSYTVAISCGTVTVVNPAVSSGIVNAPFSQAFAQSGGQAPVTFTTASALPAGLSLATDGTLSGTPTVNGTFPITVTATDTNNCAGTGEIYNLVISCPTITLAALANGTANAAYSSSATASPAGTYTYAVTAGLLPPGLTLNTSTGAVTGTPTTNGTYNFTITATGWGTCTGNQAYTLVISCPTITLAALAATGTANTPYSSSAAASPAGTYSYAVTAGSLPPGLTLSSTSGTVTGTPTTNGTYDFTITASGWGTCTGSQAQTLTISCPTITLAALAATGTANTPYSSSAAASPAGTYTYAVTSGSLPPGLTLNISTGAVTGTPTTNGTYTFTITATGWGTCTGSQAYTLTIVCPTITLAALANGTANTAYNSSATASPAGTYTYAVAAGSLPPGLTLNTSTGAVTGTPTTNGTYTFTLTATGWGTCTGSQAYTLIIGCPTITLAALGNGTANMAYTGSATASPAGTTYTYAVSAGSLPPGLTLNTSTGAVTGTPTTSGTYTFTLTATGWGTCTGSQAYTLTIACPTITLSPASPLPGATVGTVPYSQTFSATPAGTTYTYTVTGGTLPPGLTLNPATGVLSGTVTAAGTYTFTLTATGWGTCAGSRSYSLTAICPAITVSPASLPGTLAGTPYTQTLTASGGIAPYTFTVTSGTLPAGLSLTSSGVLSGTPTAGGSFGFTVTATDAYGCTGSRTYTVVIASFDLNFYDDAGRSRVCVNSLTGDWKWTVLQGPSIGTYTGSGIPSWSNSVLTIAAPPGMPYAVSLRYQKLYKRATGSFSYPSKRLSSTLMDNNTANNPPGC